jgi:valyl-tRNA synthetase
MEPVISETRWDKAMEKQVWEKWKSERAYAFDSKSKKPVYSIDTPPPYVNTPVHIGQATTYVLMDMFARFRRMTGHEVLFPLGLDRNGLPIEMAAEKKFGVRFAGMERRKVLEHCESILREASTASTETFLRSGISFNSWELGPKIGDVYYTDSPEYRALTQATFIDLWKKGLIYEDNRITNYCPGCRTTLADAEINYEELPSTFNDVKFRVKETGEEIIIGTTRPELICTCAMVIFNPADKRYKKLEGKTAVTPVFNKEVPIKAHPMAQTDKGTGLEMMCSAGDLNDIRFFREMRLPPVIAINIDGTMNGHAGVLKGLHVKKAREKMIELLREKGLLVKQKKMLHRAPVCERSKDPIEFIALPEFYLKQLEFRPKMLEFAKKLNFFAPASRQIFTDWVNSLTIDWPLSRRRFYATEIPLWYCKKCGDVIVPQKGKYYQPWKEASPVKKCPKCGCSEFRGEERVFDTWFDSSISPLWILGYERHPDFFAKHRPCTLRPQGKEIIRTWLYYTVLKDYLLTNELIFRDVWINYHIVDESGGKMSKSRGNVIDPKDVLDRFGAEPFRLWAAAEGNLEKKDFKCSFERIQGMEKSLTKLWNVARFISMYERKKKPAKLEPLDEWILHETAQMVKFARKRCESYDFHNPTVMAKNFLWETFASHYMELVKNRAYNQDGKFSSDAQASALYTLHECLDLLLKLLAPVTPIITSILYEKLRGRDIHAEPFPEPPKAKKPAFSSAELMELNGAIWKAKKDAGKSLKDPLKSLAVPEKFKCIEADLKLAHGVQKMAYSGKTAVEV